MKKHFISLAVISMFLLFSTNFVTADNTNAPQASVNAFAKHYGQILEASERGPLDALVYIDLELEDGKVLDALLNLGYTITVATDWFDFSTELNTGDYGLAVAFNQNFTWESTGAKPTLLPALTAYIGNGGSVVFGDWRTDNDFATLFEAQFTGVNNQTQMTLDASIEDGLPNPLTLSNTGWGIFSTGLVAIGGGQALATFPNGDASIVRGNSGRTIILGYLSDTPPADDRQQLFENLFVVATDPPVPLSNWALYLGIFLMIAFVVIRFRRMI
ncbi:MAG: hypothetical protein IH597_12475 [Bacteroidales bacterium]|nr:hypothetical protein [Bacteroidales bacterium]